MVHWLHAWPGQAQADAEVAPAANWMDAAVAQVKSDGAGVFKAAKPAEGGEGGEGSAEGSIARAAKVTALARKVSAPLALKRP